MISGTCGRGWWGVWPCHLVEKISQADQLSGSHCDTCSHNRLKIKCASSKHWSDFWPNLGEGETCKRANHGYIDRPFTKRFWNVIWINDLWRCLMAVRHGTLFECVRC